MESDRELMGRVLRRDTAAFEALFARYQGRLHRHLTGMVRDSHAADDLTQEALLRVWTRAEQWTGSGSFRGWLFRIATNLALNHLRTVRRQREQAIAEPPWLAEDDEVNAPAWLVDAAALGPDAVCELVEQEERIRRLVEALPASKREVLYLVREQELELREVAARLGIPEGTVKSRLHYATKRLAREWDAENGES